MPAKLPSAPPPPADAARAAGAASVTYVADKAQAPGVLAGLLRPGDLALTVGAGDVTAIGPQLLAVLDDPAGRPSEGG